jgi:RND family efflux transporter MFP subunit
MKRDQWFPNGLSRILALGARLAFGSPAFVSWGACGSAPPPDPGATPMAPVVPVAEADRSLRAMQTEVVGTVRAAREATIAPLLSGTVTEVHVAIGSQVRAGDVLVRLSAREVDARLEQAKVLSEQAARERDRAVTLKDRGAIPLAQFEATVAQWDVARARQEEAATVAEWTVLRAPFAAVITAKLVSVGDTALPGQRLLVLEGRGAFRFEARVPESGGYQLRVGDRLPVRIDELPHELEGIVAEIQPAADDATRTRLVKIDLPRVGAPPGAIRSGQFGRALLTGGKSFMVTVPVSAVARRGQLEMVFVIDEGMSRLRLVRTGLDHDGRVEIFAGLSGGEKVALVAAAGIVDGQRVRVQGPQHAEAVR